MFEKREIKVSQTSNSSNNLNRLNRLTQYELLNSLCFCRFVSKECPGIVGYGFKDGDKHFW